MENETEHQAKLTAAKDISQYLNHYIAVMDAKATAFLAGNVGAAAYFLSSVPEATWSRTCFFGALVLFAGSTMLAGGVIFPRLPAKGNSIIFWGDIARQPNFKGYWEDFQRVVDGGFLDEQYCVQNYQAARVLRRKYRWLCWSISSFVLAISLAFLSRLLA